MFILYIWKKKPPHFICLKAYETNQNSVTNFWNDKSCLFVAIASSSSASAAFPISTMFSGIDIIIHVIYLVFVWDNRVFLSEIWRDE